MRPRVVEIFDVDTARHLRKEVDIWPLGIAEIEYVILAPVLKLVAQEFEPERLKLCRTQLRVFDFKLWPSKCHARYINYRKPWIPPSTRRGLSLC